MMETTYVCTVQYGSHEPHVVIWTLDMWLLWLRKWTLDFNFNELKLNGYMELVTTILESGDLKDNKNI